MSDTSLQVFTVSNSNIASFTAATQHANDAGNAAQTAAGNAVSAVANIGATVTNAVQPALTAAQTALSTAQAYSGIQLDFRSTTTAVPRNPTSTELAATAGDILGMRTNTAGQQQPIKWNRTGGAWVDYALPLADAPSVAAIKSAIGNLALTTLSTRAQTDGPQFVNGSRWTWKNSGTANGGTVVAASGGGFWYREYPGSTVFGSWFGMVADYDWGTNTGTDNTDALRRMVMSGASVCVIEDALLGYFLDVSAGREIVIPEGTTVTGSGKINYCRRHVQYPFAKLVVKQTTHNVFRAATNATIRAIMFVYPTMDNHWVSSMTGGVKDLTPTANPAALPTITTYPASITAFRPTPGDSVEGFTLERVGIVGGSSLYDCSNSTTQQLTVRQPFGYCFGTMFTLGRGYDSVRFYDSQISPNFLPDGTTIDFMSYVAKMLTIFIHFVGKIDDFKMVGGLIYGQRVPIYQEGDPSAGNYCTGGVFIDVAMDACHVGYLIAGRTPGFGLKIIGGFITPIIGDGGKCAVMLTGANASGSHVDMIGVDVYGNTDGAVLPVSGPAVTAIFIVGGAVGCSVTVAGGKMSEYTAGDGSNDGMGGWWYADGSSVANLRISASNLIRADNRAINTAHDGVYVTAGGNSAPTSSKGFLNRAAFVALTSAATGSANPTQAEFNLLFANVRDIRLALIAAGLMASS